MARSFLPWTFTGGVRTTSRVESVNNLIKRYVNSGSEVVDFIQFIIAFEKKLLMKSSKSKIISHSNQYDPVLRKWEHNFLEFCWPSILINLLKRKLKFHEIRGRKGVY